MKWLTSEEAVVAGNLSVTSEELIEYTSDSQEETIEEKFQKVGLLFDRDRYQSGKPYLALLSPIKTQASEDSADLNSLDDEDLLEEIEEETNNLSSTSSKTANAQEEPYIFEKCSVELHLTFKPDDGHPDGRIVIISATSHGDFPVCEKIRESSLGELPLPLKELLRELVADFTNRQLRRQFANTRNQKKRTTTNPNPPTIKTSSTTPTEPKNTGTQLTLFGI